MYILLNSYLNCHYNLSLYYVRIKIKNTAFPQYVYHYITKKIFNNFNLRIYFLTDSL